MARQGKIARLPAALKSEVNRRLHDGEGAPQILPWLNSQPEAIRIWEAWFEGVPASPQNLSEWRLGGHKEWIRKREGIERLKELQDYSIGLVNAANGKLSDGLAAIAAGEIMDVMENIGNIAVTGGSDDAEKDPLDGLVKITNAIKALQDGDRKREESRRKDETVAINKQRLELGKKQLALAWQRFRDSTVSKLMEIARKPEFMKVLGGRETDAVKMEKLHQMLFGDAPKQEGES